jgi:hypothetical protein
MITHLVFWKFKRKEDAQEAARQLNALRPVVNALSLTAGTNLLEGGWDLALASTFAGQAELDAYQSHPEHQKVVAFIRARAEERSAVDFES